MSYQANCTLSDEHNQIKNTSYLEFDLDLEYRLIQNFQFLVSGLIL